MSDLRDTVKKLQKQLKEASMLGLKKTPTETRVAAARDLGELTIPPKHPLESEVLEILRDAAAKDDKDVEVRKVAIQSIGKLGIKSEKTIFKFLNEVATKDAVAAVRVEACHTLGQFKFDEDKETETLILRPLRVAAEKDNDKTVRCAALDALMQFKSVAANEKIAKEMIHLLEKDSEETVRQKVIILLGAISEENPAVIGDEMVGGLLSAMGRDYFEDVRNAAADSLAVLSGSSGRGEDVTTQIVESLSKSKIKNERANLCKGLLRILGSPKAAKNFKAEDVNKLQETNTKEADENLTKALEILKK